MKAKEILIYMIETLLFYLEELAEITDIDSKQFAYGEKTAYIECLEMMQLWEGAKKHSLNFDIETKFPL